MRTNLNHSATAQYCKDYIYNKGGIHILQLKTLEVPFEYQFFLEEGKHKTNSRTTGEFVHFLLLKYCADNPSSNLQKDLKSYLDYLYSVYSKGTSFEAVEIENIYLPIDLFELIIEERPKHNETSLNTMLSDIVPKYVAAIIRHYYEKALRGETI